MDPSSAPLLVVIDGPAGAGKTTVSRQLALRLGLPLLDTGAIYRTLAWIADRERIGWDDEAGLVRLCEAFPIAFGPLEDTAPQRVWFEGKDVTREIREPRISEGASRVSRHARVRASLLPIQRALGAAGCVAEGRDMGTVVFPAAPYKFFLTADLQTRAQRRHDELSEDGGHSLHLGEVERTIEARDMRDSGRKVSPLAKAEDAVVVDTSALGIDAVIERMLEIIARGGGPATGGPWSPGGDVGSG